MATKWKNLFKKWRERPHKKISVKDLLKVAGFLLLASAALFVLFGVLEENWDTRSVWRFGVVINAGLAPAVVFFVGQGLAYRYRDWMPKEAGTGSASAYYEEWKTTWKRQQKIFFVVLAGLLLMSYVFFCLGLDGWEFFYGYGHYVLNLAKFYLLFAIVLLQSALAEFVLIRFMLGRLQLYMDLADELRQREMEAADELRKKEMEAALEAALELERESRERMSKSDQLRMDLITNVSHDLKTPLTSMVGYLELLKKEELGDTARDYLEVIVGRAGKLKEMIESLFSLAKVSSGNVEMKRERIVMNRLTEQVFADMEDRVKDSELEFVTRLCDEDTGFMADSGYMYRICQNLLDNALKYSAKGTRVFIKTYMATGKNVCLEVTNTAGYRMNFEKEDIVERFARGDQSRTTEGNGLGLAIVSTYAKAMGGHFDIYIDCDQFKARLMFPREESREQMVRS